VHKAESSVVRLLFSTEISSTTQQSLPERGSPDRPSDRRVHRTAHTSRPKVISERREQRVLDLPQRASTAPTTSARGAEDQTNQARVQRDPVAAFLTRMDFSFLQSLTGRSNEPRVQKAAPQPRPALQPVKANVIQRIKTFMGEPASDAGASAMKKVPSLQLLAEGSEMLARSASCPCRNVAGCY
jgi:hypothetical protein